MTLLVHMATHEQKAVNVDLSVHIGGALVGLHLVPPVTAYLASLLAMFGISACYNVCPRSKLKWLLWRADHASIVVFSAIAIAMMLQHPFTWYIVAGFVIYAIGTIFLFWTRWVYHNAAWHSLIWCAAFTHYWAIT